MATRIGQWAATFLAAWIVAGASAAAGIQVTPPEDVAFNYPPPAVEGVKDYFTIAQEGRARCVIVRPARPHPEELRAAATLKAYLDLATGANIPHLYEGQRVPEGMGVIYVGGTALAKAAPLDLPDAKYGEDTLPNVNGYLVKTVDPKTLVIRGGTERATMLGVVGFLKRYAGVRRYWPGNPGGIGDVIPKAATLRVPQVEWRDWPYFVSRIMSGMSRHGPKPDASYRGRVRFDDFLRMNYTIKSNESYYKWLPPAKYGSTNPEFFPLIDGKRHVPKTATSGPRKGRDPQGWQPCVSNPRVAEIMANALIDYFRKNPESFAINLAVNDGLGDCRCEKCRAMDTPGADLENRKGLCDRYVKFDNRVCDLLRREFPGKLVAFIAYGSMREPPTTVRLHPMLLPVLCVGGNTFEMWDKWMATGARHMGVYFYHDDMWFFMPKLDVRQSAKRLRYLVGSGRARHFYQEFYGTWPLDGMVGYVEAETIWDPRKRVEDITREYYEKFYGPAATAMARFYGALESGYERWIEEEGIPHPFGKDNGSLQLRKSFEQFKVLNVSEAAAARRALDDALAAAKGENVVRQRLDVVNRLFTFAHIGARQYWAMRRLKEARVTSEAGAEKTLAAAREVLAVSRQQAEHKRDVMEKKPAIQYAGHYRDEFYASIGVGRIHPEVMLSVSQGLDAISAYFKEARGPEAAGTWWGKARASEKDPVLEKAMAAAEVKARGVRLANEVKDPGFEKRGASKVVTKEENLPPEHRLQQGLNTWHSRGTPMHCAITDEEAHEGKYSVVLWGTQRAGLSERLQVSPGELLQMSVWVKHNDKKGRYSVSVIPRSGKGMLARTQIPIPWKPGEWQEIRTDFTAPMDTATVGLYVFVMGQEPGAKLWVDDFFIGRYPQ